MDYALAVMPRVREFLRQESESIVSYEQTVQALIDLFPEAQHA